MKSRGSPSRALNLSHSAVLTLLFGVAMCSSRHAAAADPPAVDGARIENADAEARNWLSYGRTYSEQRYSPLNRINSENAKNLGLAWFADLDTNRGQEATPLAIDGVVYISTAWSMVKLFLVDRIPGEQEPLMYGRCRKANVDVPTDGRGWNILFRWQEMIRYLYCRNVDQAGIRTKGHGYPGMCSNRAW
jgi:glucose dehydrogenase